MERNADIRSLAGSNEDETCYVTARLKAKTDQVDTMIAALETLAEHTRAEPGCVEYGFYRDTADPTAVLSFEAWADADAEAKHWQTTHLKEALAKFAGLLDGEPVVTKFAKII